MTSFPTTTDGGADAFRLYGLKDNFPGAGASVTFTLNLDSGGGNGNGSIERITASPTVAGDVVFFTTVLEDTGQPCADFTSRLYALTYLGGAAYDTDGNGSLTLNENPVVSTVDGRATAPFVADQHVYFGTSGETGSQVEMFGDPEDFNNGLGQIGVRLLSWRGVP